MEYYSAIKKNSFESVLMRWMKLEPIIQSEVSQNDKEHTLFEMFTLKKTIHVFTSSNVIFHLNLNMDESIMQMYFTII